MDCSEGMSLPENTGMTVYINILTLFSCAPPPLSSRFYFFSELKINIFFVDM